MLTIKGESSIQRDLNYTKSTQTTKGYTINSVNLKPLELKIILQVLTQKLSGDSARTTAGFKDIIEGQNQVDGIYKLKVYDNYTKQQIASFILQHIVPLAYSKGCDLTFEWLQTDHQYIDGFITGLFLHMNNTTFSSILSHVVKNNSLTDLCIAMHESRFNFFNIIQSYVKGYSLPLRDFIEDLKSEVNAIAEGQKSINMKGRNNKSKEITTLEDLPRELRLIIELALQTGKNGTESYKLPIGNSSASPSWIIREVLIDSIIDLVRYKDRLLTKPIDNKSISRQNYDKEIRIRTIEFLDEYKADLISMLKSLYYV